MSTVQVESYPAIIGGEKVHGKVTFEDIDPSTGRPCATVARCGEDEIDQAVEAAREAHEKTWRQTTPEGPCCGWSTNDFARDSRTTPCCYRQR